jgi:hypothetical protein
MRNRWSRFFFGAVLTATYCILPTTSVSAANVDLSLDSNSISFSEETLYAGNTIRIYARVKNIGDADASAHVLFYQGGMLIGKSQAVSLRAGGSPDDVFVDFEIPNGSFNIRAVLQGTSPQDQNPANDATQTSLYYPIIDADRDGVLDDDDTCVSDSNADQRDTDDDGMGDVCDSDDDGDGVSDTNDQYPLDATKSSDPAPVVVAAPITKPVAQAPEPTSPSTSTQSSDSASSSADKANSGLSDSDETAEPPSEGLLAAFTFSDSRLTTSPLARFSWKQTDWRTYEFTLADQPEESVQFSWDFGDGATSVQPQILHAFSGPGTYTVTLTVVDDAGNILSDAETFDVTFFHLDNPQVIGLIILLFVALFSFGYAFIKLRSPYDQGASHK